MKKMWVGILAAIILFGAISSPGFAKTKGDFDVSLSDYKVDRDSSVEFEVPTGNAYLVSGKNIKITFSSQWQMPKKIDDDDVLINGKTPKDVKVSGQTITIVTPKGVSGDEDFSIEISKDAGLSNPKKAGEYTLRVYAELEEKSKQNGKSKVKEVRKSFQSENISIEDPNKKPTTPTKPTNPHPIPTTPEQLQGGTEVIVRIGSTIGYYQKPNKTGKGMVTKVGKLSAAPYLSKGNSMIPFRFIAEGLDSTIGFDEKTGIIGVHINGKYMEFKAGDKTAVIEGLPVQMPIAPEIKEKQIMLPLRFVVEKMGAKAIWFDETQTIFITK
ncbi:stalk domain-containing protein [Brevibacillus sp. NPDC058079]|uniref:stalk domain-containing protein n=1 Tax=Brevibacillus sp. NPDC058079 TaxID=3346330 RepID=UPI0036E8515A